MDRIKHLILATCLLAIAGVAQAAQITGSIAIGGSTEVYDNGSVSTGLDWNCASCGADVNNFPAPTGDFSTLGGLGTVSGELQLYSFYYSSIPQQVIWEITYNGLIYSFTLTSVQVAGGDTTADNFRTLALTGTGYFTITDLSHNYAGYDQTYGDWTFSNSAISFSSATIATPVSEPGTIALLGLGLLGIGVASRIRKSA